MGFQKKKNVFSNGDVLGGTKFSCFFGTSVCAALFFNEQEEVGVSQAHRSQLATAAVSTEQHQMKAVSCGQSYLTQLIEYGQGLQHTPELERHQNMCGML